MTHLNKNAALINSTSIAIKFALAFIVATIFLSGCNKKEASNTAKDKKQLDARPKVNKKSSADARPSYFNSIVFIRVSSGDKHVDVPAAVVQRSDGKAFVQSINAVSQYTFQTPLNINKNISKENTSWEIVLNPGTTNSSVIPAEQVYKFNQIENHCLVCVDEKLLPPPIVIGDLQTISSGASVNMLEFETDETGTPTLHKSSTDTATVKSVELKPQMKTVFMEAEFDEVCKSHFGFAFDQDGKLLGSYRNDPKRNEKTVSVFHSRVFSDAIVSQSTIKSFYVNDPWVSQPPLESPDGNVFFFCGVTSIFAEPASIQVKYEIINRDSQRRPFEFTGNAKMVELKKVDFEQWPMVRAGQILDLSNRKMFGGEQKPRGQELWICEAPVALKHYFNSFVDRMIIFQFYVNSDPIPEEQVSGTNFQPVIKGQHSLHTRLFPGNIGNNRSYKPGRPLGEKPEPVQLTGPGTKIVPGKLVEQSVLTTITKTADELFQPTSGANPSGVNTTMLNIKPINGQCPLTFNHDQTKAIVASSTGEIVMVNPETLEPSLDIMKLVEGLSAIQWHGQFLIGMTADNRRIIKIDPATKQITGEMAMPDLIFDIDNGYDRDVARIALHPKSNIGVIVLGSHLVTFDVDNLKPQNWIQLKANYSGRNLNRECSIIPMFDRSGTQLILEDVTNLKRISLEGEELILRDTVNPTGIRSNPLLTAIPFDLENKVICNFHGVAGQTQGFHVFSIDLSDFANYEIYRSLKEHTALSRKYASTNGNGQLLILGRDTITLFEQSDKPILEAPFSKPLGAKHLPVLNGFICWNDESTIVIRNGK